MNWNLGLISNRKKLAIFILLLCIFLSFLFSYAPYIVNLQNKNYFERITGERTHFLANSRKVSLEEGMTDMSANNIIYSIINDVSGNNNEITPYQQLMAVRSVALMGDYSNTNLKTLTDILDNSGNSDNTKLSNVNRYLLTYSTIGSSASKSHGK